MDDSKRSKDELRKENSVGVSVKEHDGIELELKGKGYRIRAFRLVVDEEGKEEKFIMV